MNKITAVLPGFFDPFHLGHLQLISTTQKIFPRVIVAVGQDNLRSQFFWPLAIRLQNVKETLQRSDLLSIEVVVLSGLLVDFVTKYSNALVIRGSNNVNMETCRALMNLEIAKNCHTIIIPCATHAYISATLVRELVKVKAKLEYLIKFVPKNVAQNLIKTY